MKSSLDLKKCETKLNSVYRSIGLKEAEKITLDKECSKLKNEIAPLTNQIKKTNNVREKIKIEIGDIKHQVEKKHDEMNRTKANLLYNTKREYEEMIRRLQNEMQFNHRSFSSREETRILNEITSLTHGITLIESYEQQKKSYDSLKGMLTAKKSEQEATWNQVTEYKKQYHMMYDKIKELANEIQRKNSELEELTTIKLGLKKQIEDLSREQVIKQQQLKRQNLEKLKFDKQFKKDHLIISYEDDLRDQNKLINYFHKLIYGKEETPDNDHKSETGQTFVSNSFASGGGGYQSSSESSSLASSTNSVQFNHSNVLNDLKNQLTLGLSKVTLNQSGNNNKNANELLTPLPSPCLSTNSSLNTPCNDDHPPFFCANGSYMMKKKINESNPSTQHKKNRKLKKNQQKNSKISHSVEVINLLSKMQIPIQLSSQFEECLKELRNRKEKLIHEMNTYKLNLELEQDQRRKQEELLQNNLSANNSNILSDTYSDISSCLDSNYESDNNSVRSYQSSLLIDSHKKRNSIGLLLLPDSAQCRFDENKESLDRLGSEMSMSSTATNSSNGPVNSDDSDVTINESTLNEKELRLLSAQITKNDQINDSTTKNTNSTALPETQLTSSTLTRTKSSPGQHSKSNNNADNNSEIKNNFTFLRQVSDGYSSSCTPLSASSITNEQPHVNPFFLNSVSTGPATPGIIQTNDPIETAFLNTNNLNK